MRANITDSIQCCAKVMGIDLEARRTEGTLIANLALSNDLRQLRFSIWMVTGG
jgi:hypothetical protein